MYNRDLTLLQNSWMSAGKNKEKWDYVSKRVIQSAKDLMYKKQIPQYAWSYLTDPAMLKEGIEECFKAKYHEWSCPECGICVFAPRKWLHFHLGKHGRFRQREQRGGEHFQMKFKLY